MTEKQFIDLIIKERIKKKLSQKEVALKLGISVYSYWRIENNHRQLTFNNLVILAKLYDLNLNILKNTAPHQPLYD